MSPLLERVRASGSSFYWAIRLLPGQRREGMAALYLFCRAVDDIADVRTDAPALVARQRNDLVRWRACLADPGRLCPDPALGTALAEAIARFNLPVALFQEIVDGVAMDLPPGCIAPDAATFTLYCRRVAGAVGLLSVRIFGCQSSQAEAFALATGDALQITNILRDVAEDAAQGRLYLPREELRAAGIESLNPQAVLHHPRLPVVLDALARGADEHFAKALHLARSTALPGSERRRLRSGLVMLAIYRLLLKRLRQRGWSDLDHRPRLGRIRLMGTVLRWRLFGA